MLPNAPTRRPIRGSNHLLPYLQRESRFCRALGGPEFLLPPLRRSEYQTNSSHILHEATNHHVSGVNVYGRVLGNPLAYSGLPFALYQSIRDTECFRVPFHFAFQACTRPTNVL